MLGLHEAARRGDSGRVSFFLSNGYQVNLANSLGDTPLLCADYNNASVVQQLLDAGASVNDRSIWNFNRQPLHLAVIEGSSESIKLLLDAGSDVNALDQNMANPLFYAALSRSYKIMQLLLERGASIDFRVVLQTRIYRDAKLMTFLLKHRALTNDSVFQYRTELLIITTQYAKSVQVRNHWTQKLLRLGIDMYRYVPELGSFAFTSALVHGTVEQVRMLMQHGALVGITDPLGNNLLHYAHSFKGEVVAKIKLLLSLDGIDVNQQNLSGITPIMYAMYRSPVAVIKLLIDHGAEYVVKDQTEPSFLSYLTTSDSRVEIFECLCLLLYKSGGLAEADMHIIWGDEVLTASYEECFEELDKMRRHCFYRDMTILDILLRNMHELKYIYEEYYEKVFASTDKTMYKTYRDWLVDKFLAARLQYSQLAFMVKCYFSAIPIPMITI